MVPETDSTATMNRNQTYVVGFPDALDNICDDGQLGRLVRLEFGVGRPERIIPRASYIDVVFCETEQMGQKSGLSADS